ncbi:filamentous hemagglutinin N-terminal domain-containing protein [Laspinema sp. D1]|uniref:two-partner secretion domain-containing protein n=1 Tax=Laspinema palackyanum TaxID=3231601 RepID=UPI00346B8997|nr:filamentous hemagglutinin N-terminal domain-containing protein [Laspinema sp. D2b]
MINWGYYYLSIFSVVSAFLFVEGGLGQNSLQAQVIPDNTLPNPSGVQVNGNTLTIEGGTAAGSNLFHSFQEFSIPTGSTAIFNNSTTIANIITRITGGKLSQIDGAIAANGSANLFLINPSGIAFGPNASLNLGGSFVGSTANRVLFPGDRAFSATDPDSSPILSVNVPIGLQYGPNPESIVVRDGVLTVLPNQTLTLVGGEIILEGGQLLAPGGTVSLGGISEAGVVELQGENALKLPETVRRSPLTLTNGAQVNVAGAGGGSISIQVENLLISGQSEIRGGIGEGLGEPGAQAGNIEIDTTGNIVLTEESAIANEVQPTGIGQGGNITLNATTFSATSSVVSTSTSGEGDGGKLQITARDSVVFDGQGRDDFTTIASADVAPEGVGNAGGIEIQARSVLVKDGAGIITGTRGRGNGAPLIIRAVESVVFDGLNSSNDVLRPTGAESTVDPEAMGNAGSLEIETAALRILNGANVGSTTFEAGNGGPVRLQATEVMEFGGVDRVGNPVIVFSDTLGEGNGDNLRIETPRLILRDGAQISVGTFGAGDGGNLEILATEAIVLSGSVPATEGGFFFTDESGTLFPTGIFAASTETGNAGTMRLQTGQLMLGDRAIISASGESTGVAGNMEIVARQILLNNAAIAAETVQGDQANIFIESRDIRLRNQGGITTNASGSGTGGNIAIATDTLVAVENSDITANSSASFGGRVAIAAQGILGTNFRTELTPQSDITATSELGAEFSGSVTINTPDVNPSTGLVELPEMLGQARDNYFVGCALSDENSFTISGRGGLPTDPTQPLQTQPIWHDLRNFSQDLEGETVTFAPSRSRTPSLPEKQSFRLKEATAWRRDADGTIELITAIPEGSISVSGSRSPNCQRIE